jgi:Effector-associated domain 1
MILIRLTSQQREALRQAMLGRYQNAAGVEDMLQKLDQKFQYLSVRGQNLPQDLGTVIEAAQAEGWLLELVKQVRRDVPGDPQLQLLESELVPLVPPHHVDSFEMCCLAGNRVMVDRDDLRASLKVLSTPLGRRIMVVTGRKNSGKSHSGQLISYLRDVRGNFSLALIDLAEYGRMLGADAIVQPRDIAEDLVDQLGYRFKPAKPPTDAQWSRWVYDFCRKFAAHAMRDGRCCWVVIDGFGSVVLPQPTLDLIKGLAVKIDRSLTKLRLILLGYGDSFPPCVLPQVELENIGPIGVREVTTFFGRAYQQLAIPFTEDALEDSVSRVLDDLDLEQHDFLFHLEMRVMNELARVAEQGGGL